MVGWRDGFAFSEDIFRDSFHTDSEFHLSTNVHSSSLSTDEIPHSMLHTL